jgi:SnoaL-like domain
MSVSDADVAVVRAAFDEFETQREDLDGYFQRFWHPDAVIESADAFPVPGHYEGLEGYKRWYDDSFGPYDEVHRHLHSLEAHGQRVVMLLTITGHGGEDDVELEVQIGSTYEVDGGRIRRLCVYLSHERALEAARAD